MVNVFDVFVVLMAIGLGFIGFREGLVRGVINLAGFLALILALVFYSETITAAAKSITAIPPQAAIPLMFVFLLVLGTAATHIIALVIHKTVHMTPIGLLDTGLGAVLGLLKAVVFCALLATVLSFSPDGSWFRNQYDASASAAELVNLLNSTVPYIEKSLAPYFRQISPLIPHQPPANGNGGRLNDAI